jgi:hypothetical protein
MKHPMMKCGHSANGVSSDGQPCCVICIGIDPGAEVVDDKPPDLSERRAKCSSCPRTEASSPDLAFFEHRPDQPMDSFYDGCRGWD